MRQKRWLAIALLVVVCLVGCGKKEKGFTPGTYGGKAAGFNPDTQISVDVVIGDEGKISDILILEEKEMPEFGGVAIAKLKAAMIEANSSEVDGVSGATVSSNGFKAAVNAALVDAQ